MSVAGAAIDIAAGNHFTLALRPDGTVVGWGGNGSGQLNVPPAATGALRVVAGGNHSAALVPTPCLGDVTGNGYVDGVDLAAVLAAWGPAGGSEFDCDFNEDGFVNGTDLGYLLSRWGPCGN
jgi:hypothetical protein